MRQWRNERGHSLVEMLTVLVILEIVIGGLTTLFQQGSNAEIDMNYRFQAQQDARIALDRRSDLKVLYITGFWASNTVARDKGVRFGAMLLKPIRPTVLREAVGTALAA